MSMTEIVVNNNNVININNGFTPDQIQVIKSQIAKGATDDELKMFISIAQKYKLDPFTKEIWFIKRAKKFKDNYGKWDYKRLSNGEIDYSDAETMIYTSRDGYLSIGQRHPEWNGIMSFVVRENDNFEVDAQNLKIKHSFGIKRGKIVGAWAKSCRKGQPDQIVFVDFSEYYDDKSTTWKNYPSAMIQKVAEAFALKRQFGISGLVTKEEMYSREYEVLESGIEYLKAPNELVSEIEMLIERYCIEDNDIKKVLESGFGKDDINKLTEKEALSLIDRLNKKFGNSWELTIGKLDAYVNSLNDNEYEEMKNVIKEKYNKEDFSGLNLIEAVDFLSNNTQRSEEREAV